MATDGAGRIVVKASRQPFFDAARTLLRRGVAPDAVILARHRASPTTALHATVGEAARWAVEESDRGGLRRRRWKPLPTTLSCRDGVAENAEGAATEGKAPRGGARAASAREQ